jgi:hypothetical protein
VGISHHGPGGPPLLTSLNLVPPLFLPLLTCLRPSPPSLPLLSNLGLVPNPLPPHFALTSLVHFPPPHTYNKHVTSGPNLPLPPAPSNQPDPIGPTSILTTPSFQSGSSGLPPASLTWGWKPTSPFSTTSNQSRTRGPISTFSTASNQPVHG